MTELQAPRPLVDLTLPGPLVEALAWRLVLAMHVLLAAFISFGGYPITQDGPAHLYGAHILASLARNPRSPFANFFASNLHPVGNSLFSYVAVWGDGTLSPRHLAGLATFVPLVALPLSVLAFAGALRADAGPDDPTPISVGWAAALACPLAYNYFLYRGFFNFVLAVPLALGCLAALLHVGAPGKSGPARALSGALACVLAALAALAHPAATVFLVFACAAACLAPPRRPRVYAGVAVELVLVVLLCVSRITSGRPEPVVFSSPLWSLLRVVRVLGVTLTWAEVVPALLLLALMLRAGVQVLRPLRTIPLRWRVVWPAACAAAMMLIYFFVPFEYGGAAGLDERIPMFAAVLLLPYIAPPRALARWLPVGFAVFALYVGAENIRVQRLASEVRDSSAVAAIPRGSVTCAVSLSVKNGALSADLGRHVLAELALRRDLVMPEVFCSHPAHPLRCKPSLPAGFDESLVEDYEHLSPAARRASLADPRSSIRRAFRQVVHNAARADYLLVLMVDPLRRAFHHDVIRPLHAQLIGSDRSPLLVYRVPHAARSAEQRAGANGPRSATSRMAREAQSGLRLGPAP